MPFMNHRGKDISSPGPGRFVADIVPGEPACAGPAQVASGVL